MVFIVAPGCSLPTAPARERLTLVSAGAEPLDRLPLVPRLSLRGGWALRPADVWLLRGKVSDKELSQILAGAPSETLAAKRTPLSAWTSEETLTLVPLVVLEPAQEYSVVALSFGKLAQVTTSPSPTPIWWRWGAGPVRPGGWVIHCTQPPPWVAPAVVPRSSAGASSAGASSAGAPTLSLGRSVLEPGGVEVEILAGFADGLAPVADAASEGLGAGTPALPACVRFQMPADLALGRTSAGTETLLPPHEIAGLSFEPTPIVIERGQAAKEPPVPAIRTLGSAAFLDLPVGLAHATVAASNDGSSDASVLAFQAQAALPGPLLLGQFPRGSHVAEVALVDRQGGLGLHTLHFEIAQEQGHPVLSEVLGNPFGPEPESEWVEVVNIGRAPLSLEGFRLEDSAGSVLLPAVVLPAGGVGLVVRSDFVAGASGDVVPARAAVPIVVEQLADGGLANSGEVVRLRAPDGVVLSEIPKLGTQEGTTLARRHLLAPDWASSFAPQAAPGASPGLANTFD